MTEDPFRYAHAKADEIVWMSQNTNQLCTSPAIKEAIMECVASQEYALYPHAQGVEGLKDAVLADLGVMEYEALITNGGIEALYVLNRALLAEGDEVVATDPSFMPIHHQVRLSGAKMVELPVYAEPWKMTLEQVKEAITPKTKMLLLIDPLNPLGTEYTRDEVKGLCDIARDNDLYLVDDITYRDFAFQPTLTSEFYPEKTIFAYSFSKNCGFAGMRIGALAAPPELMRTMLPYNANVLSVNVIAQRAALAALRTKGEWMAGMVEAARRNQARVKNAVDQVEGAFIPVYPSSTNMLVIDISGTGVDPQAVQDRLLYGHGIFVRSGHYVSKRFGEHFIRVSFTVPEEGAERFEAAFPQVMNELRK